jgi:Na+/phosphate symporter
MLIAIIPLLILVVGLLMYALAANPKVQEAGRIMFFCGMLVITFVLARQTLSLG